MSKEEKKILDFVSKNPGRYTSEIAKLTGLETSDSSGGHQNWKVHDILKAFEAKNILTSKKDGPARSSPRRWRVKS